MSQSSAIVRVSLDLTGAAVVYICELINFEGIPGQGRDHPELCTDQREWIVTHCKVREVQIFGLIIIRTVIY